MQIIIFEIGLISDLVFSFYYI